MLIDLQDVDAETSAAKNLTNLDFEKSPDAFSSSNVASRNNPPSSPLTFTAVGLSDSG